jgi:SAM-dependent methyltransferase
MNIRAKLTKLFKGNSIKDDGAVLVGRPEAFDQKRKFQNDFLLSKGLKEDHSFIDIGCGVLRGGLPIIEYLSTSKYYGLDINQEALKVGKRYIKEANLELKQANLIHIENAISDIKLSVLGDFIWAFSVLIHMTDDLVYDTLLFVKKNMADNGLFYANVNIGENKDGNWREFPVRWRTLEWYEETASANGLRVKNIGQLKDFGHKSVNDTREDDQFMLVFEHKN